MPQQSPDAGGEASARRFSWGRVIEAVLLVLVAAGTITAVWLIPWPVRPKRPADTQRTPERLKALKEKTRRAAGEVERDEPPGGEGKR